MLAAVMAVSCVLSGCGISTMQEQEGHLRGLALDIVLKQKARTDSVQAMLTILKDAKQVDEAVVKEFETSLESVQAVQFKATNELSNALVRDLDARYKTLNAAEEAVIIAVSAARKDHPSVFGPTETKRLEEGIATDAALVNTIKVAKSRYLVDVQSYNQVIGLFPTSVTAKMIGEEPRVAFSLTDRQASKENAGKLIDVALGHGG